LNKGETMNPKAQAILPPMFILGMFKWSEYDLGYILLYYFRLTISTHINRHMDLKPLMYWSGFV